MSELKIHPDYQQGSPLCPVCNKKKGTIPRDGLKLCFDCNKSAIEAMGNTPNTDKSLTPEFKFIPASVYESRGMTVVVSNIKSDEYREKVFAAIEEFHNRCSWPGLIVGRSNAISGGFFSKAATPIVFICAQLDSCRLEIYISVSIFGNVVAVNLYKAIYGLSLANIISLISENKLSGINSSVVVTTVQKNLKNLVESDAFQAVDSLGNMAFDIACSIEA